MNILFVHQNMPGQFKHLAPSLAAEAGNRVVFITRRAGINISGVERITYEAPRAAHEKTHHYIRSLEDAVLHGQQVVRAALRLRNEGFKPDVVVAHPGWGEALFLKDVFPSAPLLNFCEFYYHSKGADVGFDAEDKVSFNTVCQVRVRNAHLLLSLESCDAGLSPTEWQKRNHPPEFQEKISVIFDGIDTNVVRPNAAATFSLADGRVLTKADEVVTYVARNLEPHRGFPSFMRALPKLLERRPNATVLVVGGDKVSYGRSPADGRSWRETMLDEVPFDRERVHFMGNLPYARYLSALQISSAHIYLTRPFVLSWSCVEAMAAGCLIIGSSTPPVEEMVQDGVNGLLVNYHSPDEIADKTADALAASAALDLLRQRARETVLQRYSLDKCLPQQLSLIKGLA